MRLASTTWPTPECSSDHGGEGGGQRGDLVGQRDRRECRGTVGIAVDRREARHGLGQRGEAGAVPVGPGLPEGRDPDDHQIGSTFVQHVGTETERFELARSHVLDDDVARFDQCEELLLPDRVREVEFDEPFVAVRPLEEERLAIDRVSPTEVAGGIADPGSFDLDDVGTVVGQIASTPGPGQDRGQVEHSQIGKRSHGRRLVRRPGDSAGESSGGPGIRPETSQEAGDSAGD